ncbi:MAG: hypothetical protein AB7K68_12440 [Bacteriovoracia bacterium]
MFHKQSPLIFLLPILILGACTPRARVEPRAVSEVPGSIYRERYGLADASQKLVSNKGEGREALAGTRNFRAVPTIVIANQGNAKIQIRFLPKA